MLDGPLDRLVSLLGLGVRFVRTLFFAYTHKNKMVK